METRIKWGYKHTHIWGPRILRQDHFWKFRKYHNRKIKLSILTITNKEENYIKLYHLHTQVCLNISDWMPGIESFTLLGAAYFCFLLRIWEICSSILLKYMDIVWSLQCLLLNFDRWEKNSFNLGIILPHCWGYIILNTLCQGSPTLGPQTGTCQLVCGPIGTRPHSRRWAAGKRLKLHLYLQLLPIARIITWAPLPVRSVVALDSHRSANPTWTAHARDLGCALLMRI